MQLAAVIVVATLIAPSTRLSAQVSGRTQVRCAGQTITEVVIRAEAPGFGGIFSRSPFLGHLVTTLHVTTAPSVVRNFVLLQKGMKCDPVLRSESERILRAMPFLSDASVTAYPDGAEGPASRASAASPPMKVPQMPRMWMCIFFE